MRRMAMEKQGAATKCEGSAALCHATAMRSAEALRSSKAANGGGMAWQGKRRTRTLSEACAGSPDAGMQDGGGAGPATRAAGGDGKRAARVRPTQHRGREGRPA